MYQRVTVQLKITLVVVQGSSCLLEEPEGFLSEDWLIGALSKGRSLVQDLRWVLCRIQHDFETAPSF